MGLGWNHIWVVLSGSLINAKKDPLSCGTIVVGSILPLMLFTIYMKPLEKIIQELGIYLLEYINHIQFITETAV